MYDKVKHGIATEPAYDWRNDAACLNADPELFFPIGTGGPSAEQIIRARRICSRCPVIMECLENAIRHTGQFGIAGGLTESERRARRKDIIEGKLSKEALLNLIDHKLGII